MLMVWAAEALLVPNAVSLAGLAVTFRAIEFFVRRVEEPHLIAVHGDAYRAYARAVGVFLPGIGRLSAGTAL
jgi:protein-S-isoprenylcysteine O-methyltransferase Ste14